ncbi:MAG TPA: SMP-30/gluconolactonase/LRE family protein [Gemmatimonadales bacterium]|nr:SMP-30/gluconolactonase/LRE family protein [Gemmatimonadales bacterium]
MKVMALCAAVAVLGACKAKEQKPSGGSAGSAGSTGSAAQSSGPVKTATVEGFRTPESVKWDSAQDVYFVSNINGQPNAKDGNGYISVVLPAGTVRDSAFIKGGLNAPKGLALVHDTLWVADIDVVRAYNARTAAPVATVPIPGAVFLNDIAAAPDGSLYITDTAIRFGAKGPEHAGTDQIFRIAPDHKVSVAFKGDSLGRPNGITWDAGNQRFIVVPFGGSKLVTWKPGEKQVTSFASGPGQFDGVEIVKGAVWVSSWADSSVYRYQNGEGTNLIKGVPSPADIGYDAKRNRLLIPIFTGNRVEIWQLP